jgi:hypothetical protein
MQDTRLMNLSELKGLFITPQNLKEYLTEQNPLAWVSDITGLSVDNPRCTDLELEFYVLGELITQERIKAKNELKEHIKNLITFEL